MYLLLVYFIFAGMIDASTHIIYNFHASRFPKEVCSDIVLLEKDGKQAQKRILSLINKPNSLILINDCNCSKNNILFDCIVQATPSFHCIITESWKNLQHMKTFQDFSSIQNESKYKQFLLLIDGIDDSVNCVSVLKSFQNKLPNGVTVSIVAVCYSDKPERMQTSSLFDHHLNITGFRVEHTAKGKSSIICEYLGHYSVPYKNLFSDRIVSGFLSLQLKKTVKTLTELINLLVSDCLTKYLQSTSENEQNSIFDLMCIKCLETELRKQPMGSYFDVSYMFSRYQLDDAVISKCRKSDELFVNAAVQDLMIARGIKLLPVSHQIEVLTSCVISKTIYSFYGGLSSPDLCVTAFDTSMSSLLDIFEGMMLKHKNVARCLLCILNCLYQLQESSFCTRFIEKFIDPFVSEVDFTGESITYLDVASLSYFVQVCSSISTWNIAIQDSLLSEDYPGRKPNMVTTLRLIEYSKINRKKIGAGINLKQ